MNSRIVGRLGELQAVDAVLTRVPSEFACVVLEGEAGVGKTTVWQESIQRAAERGTLVLACRPSQAESKLAFAALGDLFDGVGESVLASLPSPQRHALEVALLRTDSHGRPTDQRAIDMAVLSVVRELAAHSHVVVAVDDAQWLDAPSASALEFVARRLAAEPIGIVVAVRLTDEPATTFDRGVLASRRHVVPLGPMGIGDLHQLISRHVAHSFPRPALIRIAQASAGNPLHALEIAREWLRAGEPRAGAYLPVSGDLRELVAARVRRLPARTQDALLTAAALSHPDITLVDEASLQPASDAEIVRVKHNGRIVFRHPLYASAVYENTPSEYRRALHRRLATLIEEVDERTRHLALAATDPNEQVAYALEVGAARARTRGAWQTAAELLEQARDLTPRSQPEVAIRRGLAAAEHLAHAGDRHRASALLEQLLQAAPDGRSRAEALRLLGEIRYHDESFAEALRLLDEALRYTSDPRLMAEIELDLAYAASQVWDNKGSAGHVRRALEFAEPLADAGLLAQALAFRAMSDFLCGRGIDWGTLERAVALEDPERVVPLHRTPSGVLGLLLLYAGRLAEARERLQAIRVRAIERGDESDLAFFLCWLAWLEIQAGNFQAAQAHAEEAELVATLTHGKSMRAFAHALQALVSAHRGDIDRARRECDEAGSLAEQTNYAIAGRWMVVARCLAEVSADDMAAAWQAAEPLARFAEIRPIGEPVGVSFLPDALEALVAMGELDRAATLLDRFESCARALDRVWALATGKRCSGILLAARGDLPAAAERLQEALVEHARTDMPFELARTLLGLGRVQRRRKLRRSARDALKQALAIFERLGSERWADKTRVELGRTHLREAPAQLTPSEQRVAELAGRGLTNKQIAAQLFISPKTVEANLSRVYSKLEIASRAELGARMASRPRFGTA